ncbi:hypothetical protein DHEL01_v207941 [Diaporthe helianthi]|uniref:Uncharacterized protein n=1 Tax=Diaporthe helianthi TaxID=158607 RepID=A0A2P5HTR8_DIAHE|nr:hypothetical protein DHEL01_v207941 [Diaporthe helianthi]
MHFTTFITLLAAGYGAVAQIPTSTASEDVTSTPTPPEVPGLYYTCLGSDRFDVENSKGVCDAVSGNFHVFSGCCISNAATDVRDSYTQGCSDNGGTVRQSSLVCEAA